MPHTAALEETSEEILSPENALREFLFKSTQMVVERDTVELQKHLDLELERLRQDTLFQLS